MIVAPKMTSKPKLTMKRILIAFSILFTPMLCFSQIENFDLSTYKLPEILTRKLDFNGQLGGFQSSNYVNQSPDSPSDVWSISSDNSLAGSGKITYYQFKNSANYQGSLSISANTYLSRRWLQYLNGDERIDSTSNVAFDLNSENRFYLNSPWFVELDLNTEPSIIRNNNYIALENSNSIDLLMGYGRLEPISDARLALYILQDLKKSQRLIREPEQEEILEFARKISELKKQRFFDQRLRRIYEMKALDSLLAKQGIVESDDIVYFTHLNDNWEYSSGPQRWSGLRFSGGLKSYSNNGRRTSTEPISFASIFDFFYHDLEIAPVVEIAWHKPMNLYWQRVVSVSSYYSFSSYRRLFAANKDSMNPADLEWVTNFNLSYGYYPNSRTSIHVSPGLYLVKTRENYQSSDLSTSNEYGISPLVRAFIDYYFSPQLRLEARYNIQYGFTRDKEVYDYPSGAVFVRKHGINQNFSATLLYSIF